MRKTHRDGMARICHRLIRGAVVIALLCLPLTTTAAAIPSTPAHTAPRGLLIAPATAFLTINAGTQKTSTVTVGNYTAKPITVTLAVKQFSVNNYSYTYNFNPPSNNWITLTQNELTLSPGQSQNVAYQMTVPARSQPGGNYYTFLASAMSGSASISSTLQAASLLYLTVNGKLIRTSRLFSNSIERWVFGSQISYHFTVINTGNVYYFIYVSGKLHGLSAAPAVTPVTHILIPGKNRTFTGTIPHPLLPGIYRAIYGYTTDSGGSVQKSQIIVYIPPWSIALVLVILLGANMYYVRKKKKQSVKE